MNRIPIYQRDITNMHVDAIVNTANKTLMGGSHVDGAIHRIAEPKLLIEYKKLKDWKELFILFRSW